MPAESLAILRQKIRQVRDALLAAVRRALQPFAERQAVGVQLFSSLKKQGMEEVDAVVAAWFAQWEAEHALPESEQVAESGEEAT